jgi:hypothetical protein
MRYRGTKENRRRVTNRGATRLRFYVGFNSLSDPGSDRLAVRRGKRFLEAQSRRFSSSVTFLSSLSAYVFLPAV